MDELIAGIIILFAIFALRWVSTPAGKSNRSRTAHDLLTGVMLAGSFALFVAFCSVAMAQTDNETTNALATTAASVATPFIVTFAQDHPLILTLLAVIGFLRFVMKPIVALLHTYVVSTESKADDAALERVERHPAFKWFLFAIDWLGSIKPAPKVAAPRASSGAQQGVIPAVGILALAVALSGCASFEANAYKAIGATANLVDGSMNGWGDFVRAGRATPDDERKVRAAYEQYQKAMGAARVAVRVYHAGASANEDSVQAALNALANHAGYLVTLIEQFTTPSGRAQAPATR